MPRTVASCSDWGFGPCAHYCVQVPPGTGLLTVTVTAVSAVDFDLWVNQAVAVSPPTWKATGNQPTEVAISYPAADLYMITVWSETSGSPGAQFSILAATS